MQEAQNAVPLPVCASVPALPRSLLCAFPVKSYICFLKSKQMKKILLAAFLFAGVAASAQTKEKTQAAPGVVYGVVGEEVKAIPADQVKDKLVNDEFQGQIKAKVVEVCKAEGCWIKVERSNGAAMMVRAKDHAFLMPENIVGRTVIIEGNATVKEVTEEMRRHYAEDAGKSKKEISKIKGSEKDVQFAATGVKVLD
jgi:hypothetical protein